jgi:tetrahydromethanopterin S-methyltransferase subunit C
MEDFQLFWPTGEIPVATTVVRIIFAILIAAVTGYVLQKVGNRYGKSAPRTARMESQVLVSGILVLLALMLAFTTTFVRRAVRSTPVTRG